MNKYIITFGSSQLQHFDVVPNNVLLVIKAPSEIEARKIVFNNKYIGDKFCSSYSYSEEFISEMVWYDYRTKEYSMEELNSKLKKKG